MTQIILIAVNIAMAYYHSVLIKKGKKIQHGYWGGGYLLLAGLLSVLTGSWVLMIFSLFVRKVVFDLSLNLFRGLPLFYVSKTPMSLIDVFHLVIFKDKIRIYMAVYLVIAIVLNFFV